jgi:uncharacterized RDD family membrane protein YckC
LTCCRPATAAPGRRDDANFQPAPGRFILVGLVYFTYFHATSAGQSIGDRILGIRVLDAGTGRALPYVRAFTRAGEQPPRPLSRGQVEMNTPWMVTGELTV